MINRMIEIRQDHDETQRELARAIGYTQTQIARYETGVLTPKIEYLIAFCNHYKVSSDYILGLPKGYYFPRSR